MFPGPDSDGLLYILQTSPDSHWRAILDVYSSRGNESPDIINPTLLKTQLPRWWNKGLGVHNHLEDPSHGQQSDLKLASLKQRWLDGYKAHRNWSPFFAINSKQGIQSTISSAKAASEQQLLHNIVTVTYVHDDMCGQLLLGLLMIILLCLEE
ncbi:hypothetical protein TNCV_4010951 [Trichonephila clavipes]|nr:hypothetical protein TNCV_4010951 [Trichonephila clavipes]